MIVEVASIRVKEGQEKAFEAAVKKAYDVFGQSGGCKGLHLQKCVEEPLLYQAIIRWDTLEAHTVEFRKSELFQQWRALVGPYFAEPPSVNHFEIAVDPVDF